VALTPDGRTAVVTNYGARIAGNTLSVIDLESLAETARVDLGHFSRPHGIAWLDGGFVFTSEDAQAVVRYEPQNGSVAPLASTRQRATHMLAVEPAGAAIWTANIASGTVTRLARTDGAWTAVSHVEVGPQPEGLDVSPDGRELWVGRNGDGALSVIDTASRREVVEIAVGRVPIRVRFTPDGRRVLISDNPARQLVVVDAGRREIEARIDLDGAPIGVTTDAAGERAWISLVDRARVVEVDLRRLEVVRSIDTGGRPDGIAWVP
jgi:YVTN family beta-propeller protein